MLPALLAALAWAPALLGLGAVVHHEADPALRPGIAGLLGLAVAGAMGAWLGLGAALGPPASIAAWLCGSALFLLRRRWLLDAFHPREALLPVAVVAAASYLMRQPLFQYDTGFYHLQAIEWLTRGRVVPGIANVHFRLGFNSLWTIAAAVVDDPFHPGKSSFFLNQLPMLFSAQLAATGLARLVAGNRSFSNLMLAGTVLPIASATFGVGGLYVDYTAALFVYVALALWAAALEDGDRFGRTATPAALLSVVAPLLKISAAPLAAAGIAFALARRRAVPARWWIRTGGLAAVAVVPWLARGVLTSGCLVFPAWATCLEALPWTVPETKTRAVAGVIEAFAKMPGWTPDGSWAWFEEWPARILRHYPEAILLGSTAALGVLAWVVASRRWTAAIAAVHAAALAGSAFWFLSAPEPRFGLGFLYALGLAPLFAALSTGDRLLASSTARIAGAAALVALSIGLALRLDGRARTGTLFGLDPWRPPLLAWPDLPRFAVRPMTTASGLRVVVPLEGDCCGSEPIPCTPAAEFDPTLRFGRGYYRVSGPAVRASAR